MEVLFIGGIFDRKHFPELIRKTKGSVEYAANKFQEKFLASLKQNGVNPSVLSAPFIGPFPQTYSELFFKGFEEDDNSNYQYVSFFNLYGLRNISRYNALKRRIEYFIQNEDRDKIIFVYSPHTPFLRIANYAKQKDPCIKIILIVPDLPQYMNLNKDIPWHYRILKKIDIHYFSQELLSVDAFILLTEQMNEVLCMREKPFIVIEGIIDGPQTRSLLNNDNGIKTVVYTGKLNYSFGVLTLLNAFSLIPDRDVHLIICGGGEAEEDIIKASRIDSRIVFKGQITPEEAMRYVYSASVLVNPRQNNSVYTKYSFPSKLMEYLASGNPVVAYILDGMPKAYEKFFYHPVDETPSALSEQILLALNESSSQKEYRRRAFSSYCDSNISEKAVGKRILDLIKIL